MKLACVQKIAFSLFASAAALLFAGCQDVIFANIRKEVALKDANVTSDIRSIIRYKDEFYLANGNIYHKSNTANYYGAWSKTSAPSGQVLKVAADNQYIYALVGVSHEDENEGENLPVRRELYYSSDGASWSLVNGGDIYNGGVFPYSSSSLTYTTLMCTNAIKTDNRKAYFILSGAVNQAYTLNGASAAKLDFGTSDASTAPLKSSMSCVSLNGTVYFFNSRGSGTNETTAGGDETIYYYGSGSTLCWGGANAGSAGAKSVVYSIGCTADCLLVGTTSGITRHSLNGGVPGGWSDSFSTNADSTLSSAYNILAILVVNPEKSETATAIYASQNYSGSGSNSAQFDHICLWAYYPERGEWNRD